LYRIGLNDGGGGDGDNDKDEEEKDEEERNAFTSYRPSRGT
jgi:hypothetical protein